MRVHTFYIILLLIACGVIFYMFHQLDKAGQQIDSLTSINKEQHSELIERRNTEGRLIVEKNVALADIKSLQAAYPKLIEDITVQTKVK